MLARNQIDISVHGRFGYGERKDRRSGIRKGDVTDTCVLNTYFKKRTTHDFHAELHRARLIIIFKCKGVWREGQRLFDAALIGRWRFLKRKGRATSKFHTERFGRLKMWKWEKFQEDLKNCEVFIFWLDGMWIGGIC